MQPNTGRWFSHCLISCRGRGRNTGEKAAASATNQVCIAGAGNITCLCVKTAHLVRTNGGEWNSKANSTGVCVSSSTKVVHKWQERVNKHHSCTTILRSLQVIERHRGLKQLSIPHSWVQSLMLIYSEIQETKYLTDMPTYGVLSAVDIPSCAPSSNVHLLWKEKCAHWASDVSSTFSVAAASDITRKQRRDSLDPDLFAWCKYCRHRWSQAKRPVYAKNLLKWKSHLLTSFFIIFDKLT